MSDQDQPRRVRICDPDHPHYPESGVLTGEQISLFGKPMALLKLDSCRHGTDGCYVSQGQVAREKRAKR
jgi:hypothetical protein